MAELWRCQQALRLHEWHKRRRDEDTKAREEDREGRSSTEEPRPDDVPTDSPSEGTLPPRPGTRVRGPARLPDVPPRKPVEVPKKQLPTVGQTSRTPAGPSAQKDAAGESASGSALVAGRAPDAGQAAKLAKAGSAPSRGAASGGFERGRALAIEQALARIRGTTPAPVPETPFVEDEVEEAAEPAGDIERQAVQMGERARDVLSAWRTRQGALPLDIEEPRPKRG